MHIANQGLVCRGPALAAMPNPTGTHLGISNAAAQWRPSCCDLLNVISVQYYGQDRLCAMQHTPGSKAPWAKPAAFPSLPAHSPPLSVTAPSCGGHYPVPCHSACSRATRTSSPITQFSMPPKRRTSQEENVALGPSSRCVMRRCRCGAHETAAGSHFHLC